MRCFMSALGAILCLVALPLCAQDVTALDVTTLKDGQYLLTVRGGAVTVQSIKLIPVAPGPNPPPQPPPPSVLTERAKAVKAAAEKATADPDRSGTAKGLAMLYREMGKQVATGAIAPVNVGPALKLATDLMLTNKPATTVSAWTPTRTVIGDQLTVVSQAGGSSAEFAKLLGEVADGLDASAPQRAIDPAMLALILEILKIILALFIK